MCKDELVCLIKDDKGEYFCYQKESEYFLNDHFFGEDGYVVETDYESNWIRKFNESGFIICKEMFNEER